jgi:hypothetical protein
MYPMSLEKLFTEHPQSVGETYWEHMGNASYFGIRMVLAGLACLVHAVLPFMFVNTGSRAIEHLHARMSARRSRSVAALPAREALIVKTQSARSEATYSEGTHAPTLQTGSAHRPVPRAHRHRIAT